MKLDSRACEYYRLEIKAVPDVSEENWEMSIDEGANWHPSVQVDGLPSWLVCGSNYTGSELGSAIVISTSVKPLIRLIDNPETIIRGGVKITTK